MSASDFFKSNLLDDLKARESLNCPWLVILIETISCKYLALWGWKLALNFCWFLSTVWFDKLYISLTLFYSFKFQNSLQWFPLRKHIWCLSYQIFFSTCIFSSNSMKMNMHNTLKNLCRFIITYFCLHYLELNKDFQDILFIICNEINRNQFLNPVILYFILKMLMCWGV